METIYNIKSEYNSAYIGRGLCLPVDKKRLMMMLTKINELKRSQQKNEQQTRNRHGKPQK